MGWRITKTRTKCLKSQLSGFKKKKTVLHSNSIITAQNSELQENKGHAVCTCWGLKQGLCDVTPCKKVCKCSYIKEQYKPILLIWYRDNLRTGPDLWLLQSMLDLHVSLKFGVFWLVFLRNYYVREPVTSKQTDKRGKLLWKRTIVVFSGSLKCLRIDGWTKQAWDACSDHC